VLKEENSARIELTSNEQIREFQEVVSTHFPVLNGAWCVVDGLKIPIQKSGDEEIQNAYYNGLLHSHFVGCTLSLHHLELLLLAHLTHQGHGMTVTLLKMVAYMINCNLFMSILVELQ
jgi:hypothetical protein